MKKAFWKLVIKLGAKLQSAGLSRLHETPYAGKETGGYDQRPGRALAVCNVQVAGNRPRNSLDAPPKRVVEIRGRGLQCITTVADAEALDGPKAR